MTEQLLWGVVIIALFVLSLIIGYCLGFILGWKEGATYEAKKGR
jgi:hypothetical protein